MAKKSIEKGSIIIQKVNIDTADINGEKAMMDLDKGKYYILNGVGSRIWDIISSPSSVKDIVLKLMEEYDVDQETCEQNTLFFLGRLKDEELIDII